MSDDSKKPEYTDLWFSEYEKIKLFEPEHLSAIMHCYALIAEAGVNKEKAQELAFAAYKDIANLIIDIAKLRRMLGLETKADLIKTAVIIMKATRISEVVAPKADAADVKRLDEVLSQLSKSAVKDGN